MRHLATLTCTIALLLVAGCERDGVGRTNTRAMDAAGDSPIDRVSAEVLLAMTPDDAPLQTPRLSLDLSTADLGYLARITGVGPDPRPLMDLATEMLAVMRAEVDDVDLESTDPPLLRVDDDGIADARPGGGLRLSPGAAAWWRQEPETFGPDIGEAGPPDKPRRGLDLAWRQSLGDWSAEFGYSQYLEDLPERPLEEFTPDRDPAVFFRFGTDF